MIETYLLEYFIAFQEEGSLLKASERLHISQPSLTRAMQKLETELGICLFNRTVNKISINENGKKLTDYIRDILALNKLLMEKAKEIKNKESIIRISMTAPGPMFLFPQFFFINQDKKYTNKISSEEICLKEVLEGIVDIAFINNKIEKDGLICYKVMIEELYVCLPDKHFLASKDSVTFKELDGQSFFLGQRLGIWDDVINEKLSNSKFFRMEVENIVEVSKYSSIPSFITNASKDIYPREGKTIIKIDDKEASKNFYVIYKSKNKKIFDIIKQSNSLDM